MDTDLGAETFTADRVEAYRSVMSIPEEELGVVIAPWYWERESLWDEERLPQDECYWEIHVNARDMARSKYVEDGAEPGDNIGYDSFDIYRDKTVEEVVNDLLPEYVEEFESRFPESRVLYPDLDVDWI